MNCPKCSYENNVLAITCKKCGYELTGDPSKTTTDGKLRYAGFWKRLVAQIVDQLILIFATYIIYLFLGLTTILQGLTERGIGFTIPIWWLYFVLMEHSPMQATIGKMTQGIIVTDLNGNRIGWDQAVGRNAGKLASALILGIGFIMVAFTKKKQALHDMMSACLVVRE